MTAASHLGSIRRWGVVVAWPGVVGGSVAAIILLHALGGRPGFAVDWAHLWSWLDGRSVERVALGLGRMVVLLLGYWVAGTTILYTALRAAHLPSLARSIEWAVPSPLRRLAERTVAVALTVSTLASGAGAAVASEGVGPERSMATVTRDAGYVPVPAGDPTPATTRPTAVLPFAVAIEHRDGDEGQPDDGVPPADDRYVPRPAGVSIDGPLPPLPFLLLDPPTEDARAPDGETAADDVVENEPAEPSLRPQRAARRAGTSAGEPSEHTVVPGDNLWVISKQRLATAMERHPTEPEIAAYWVRVIEANRQSLRSGDPDLIFPGEIVRCPPIEDEG